MRRSKLAGDKLVLVTGGAGFIGSHLVDLLLGRGYRVRVLDDLSSGRMENIGAHLRNRNFEFVEGSVLHDEALARSMKSADYVFHLAAIASVQASLDRPSKVDQVNAGGTLSVLGKARELGISRVIFGSSAAVYGEAHPPISEEQAPNPTSPYGASKVAAEAYCKAFSHSYSLRTVVLRYFNVYGERSNPGEYGGVLARFARNTVLGEPLVVFGDGSQRRDFVHVKDVAEATLRAAEVEMASGKTTNIGSGRPTSVSQLISIFSGLHLGEVSVRREPSRPGDIKDSWASIERAELLLGFKPKVSLREGIKELLEWHRRVESDGQQD